jgi:two-component system response regulator PilR (NtrC family)
MAHDYPGNVRELQNILERELIVQAWRKNRFRQTRTASILGISLRQLRYRMQRLNIHDLD